MSPSPGFKINGGAVGEQAFVSAGGTVTAVLDDLTGVTQVEWSIVGTDELSDPSDYTLVTSGFLGSTVTITALAAGTAAGLKCKINGGIDPQTEQPSAAMETTAKFSVLTADGLAVLFAGEFAEANATTKTHDPINKAIRAISGGGGGGGGSGSVDPKDSVRAATTANITLSGAQTIDGLSVVSTNRVLVKNQSTASQNGIWVAAAGAWSRATDADDGTELTPGMTVYVEEGTTNGETIWACTNTGGIVVGTTSLVFEQVPSTADKAKLDAATANATASTLVQRGSSGQASFGTTSIAASSSQKFGLTVNEYLSSGLEDSSLSGAAVFTAKSTGATNVSTAITALDAVVSHESTTASNEMYAVLGEAYVGGTGAKGLLAGLGSFVSIGGFASGSVTGSLTNYYSYYSFGPQNVSVARTIASSYGLYLNNAGDGGGGGIASSYGIYLVNQSNSGNCYTIYTQSQAPSIIVGPVRFGDTTVPTVNLEIGGNSDKSAIAFGAGSTVLSSAAGTARIRFNESTNKLQISENGGGFVDVIGGASGGGWTDSGALIYPTTGTDAVTVGVQALSGSEKFRVQGNVRIDSASNPLFRTDVTNRVIGIDDFAPDTKTTIGSTRSRAGDANAKYGLQILETISSGTDTGGVAGALFKTTLSGAAASNTGQATAVQAIINHQSTGAIDQAFAHVSALFVGGSAIAAGTVGQAFGSISMIDFDGMGGADVTSGAITTAACFVALGPGGTSGSKTIGTMVGFDVQNVGATGITESMGLHIAAQSGSSQNWSMFAEGSAPSCHAPNITIGSNAAPSVAIDIKSGTSAAAISFADGNAVSIAGTNEGRLRYNGTGDYFEISENTGAWTRVATGFYTNSSNTDLIASGNTVRIGQSLDTLTAADLSLKRNASDRFVLTSTGTRHVGTVHAFESTLSNTAATFTVASAGANSLTFAAGATSVAFNQTQHASSTGNAWTVESQKGAAGSGGGALNLNGGLPGTAGTGTSGDVTVGLGPNSSGGSGRTSYFSLNKDSTNSTSFFRIYDTGAGYVRAESISSLGLRFQSPAAMVFETSPGNMTFDAVGSLTFGSNQATPTFNLQGSGGNAILQATLPHAGACNFNWVETITSLNWKQDTRTTDAACGSMTFRTQAPYASATGSNRTPGTLVLGVPAAVGGGTEGKISLEVAAAEVAKLTKTASDETRLQFAKANYAYVEMLDETNNEATGLDLFINGQSCTGTSTTGGRVRLKSGGGTSAGGELLLSAGDGITNGNGSNVVISPGAGAGTGTTGSIGLGDAPDPGGGEKVVFFPNAITNPTSNPTGGFVVYGDAGAGKARGASGTVTTFAPAEPHCQRCGRDYALEWQNETRGEHLAVCVPCLMTTLTSIGVNVNDFTIHNELRS